MSSVTTSPMPGRRPITPMRMRRMASTVRAAAPKSRTKAASSPFLRLPAKKTQGMPARRRQLALSCEPWMPWLTVSSSSSKSSPTVSSGCTSVSASGSELRCMACTRYCPCE